MMLMMMMIALKFRVDWTCFYRGDASAKVGNRYTTYTIIIIIHEFHYDTSLKQNFRAAVNVTY